jgi:hypothetical protein
MKALKRFGIFHISQKVVYSLIELIGGIMSFPRRRKSRKAKYYQQVSFWIPAFAGMTLAELFVKTVNW